MTNSQKRIECLVRKIDKLIEKETTIEASAIAFIRKSGTGSQVALGCVSGSPAHRLMILDAIADIARPNKITQGCDCDLCAAANSHIEAIALAIAKSFGDARKIMPHSKKNHNKKAIH